MYRFSNTVIGLLNLFTLLASIPIIGAGLWMAKSSSKTCESFLQIPLLIIGFIVLVISLAGFIGACFHVGWALWVYLVAMIFTIAALISLTIFGFVITSQGGGGGGGRVYKEYRVEDYSAWLRRRVENPHSWMEIKSCLFNSKTCEKIISWTPFDYLTKTMSPIQSGCCKPPTSCNYAAASAAAVQDPDCYRWNNEANILCYECETCKAGVMEDIRIDWHKISVVNIVMVVLLIGVYSIGCCAFHNTKRAETDYPYGHNRMSKIRPRWDFYWWRWWHDRQNQLY